MVSDWKVGTRRTDKKVKTFDNYESAGAWEFGCLEVWSLFGREDGHAFEFWNMNSCPLSSCFPIQMFTEDQDVSMLEGDFKCPIGSHVLPCQKDFTAHLRGHNEVRPSPDPSDPTGQSKVYHCCLCEKMLSSFSSLDRRMLAYSDGSPFPFTTKGNMHRH